MRTIIFGTILFFLIGCDEQEAATPSRLSIPHNVVNDELTESTNMAQVDVDIVLDTNRIDKIGLKQILDYHYERSLRSHTMKHHHRPTIISVRIYKTSDHYN